MVNNQPNPRRPCPICQDTLNTNEQTCKNCQRHSNTLPSPLTNVHALHIHQRNDPIRNDLHNYKNPKHPDHKNAQHRLAQHLTIALHNHQTSRIVPVPSTHTHHQHLTKLIHQAGHQPTQLLTTQQPRHQRNAHPNMFTAANRNISGPAVLIEDCYVTGATAQSAAHALAATGATPISIIAIGRRLLQTPPNPTAAQKQR